MAASADFLPAAENIPAAEKLQQCKNARAEGLLDPEAGGPLDITADETELLLAEG